MNYRVRAVQEFMDGVGEVWTASHPELLGCCVVGRTCLEATSRLPEVRDGWLRWAKRYDATIPESHNDLWVDVVFADITGMGQ